jgi:hypothetical protein
MQTQVGPSEPVEIESLKEREKWIAFAEKLLALCLEIQSAANVQITEKLFAEPKILALALLCRSFRNLKGVIALASEGLVVEARTLARSCYENSFLVAGLIEKGESFVEEMYDDDVKSMRSRGEFVLEDGVEHDMAKQLRARLDQLKAQRPKAKLLNPKEALKDSVMRRSYLFYSQLSSDAAHPSVTALKRHMVRIEEEGGWVLGLDVQPVERGTEVADTVNIACNAVLGTCVGVNQILGGTSVSPLLQQLFNEYGAENPPHGVPQAA